MSDFSVAQITPAVRDAINAHLARRSTLDSTVQTFFNLDDFNAEPWVAPLCRVSALEAHRHAVKYFGALVSRLLHSAARLAMPALDTSSSASLALLCCAFRSGLGWGRAERGRRWRARGTCCCSSGAWASTRRALLLDPLPRRGIVCVCCSSGHLACVLNRWCVR